MVAMSEPRVNHRLHGSWRIAIWWPWVSRGLHVVWVSWKMNSGGGRERSGFGGYGRWEHGYGGVDEL